MYSHHKFPFCVLHFEIAPEMVDVNVHPRKMEIRFNQNEAVYRQVYDTVRSILEGRELIPSVVMSAPEKQEKTESIPEPFELKRLASLGAGKVAESKAPYQGDQPKSNSWIRPAHIPAAEKIQPREENKPPVQKTEQLTLSDERFLSKSAAPEHRMIGQVFDTYWMAEYDGKLFIIDQHAAHEKVLYERFLKALETHQTDKQLLSPPTVVTLTAIEQQIFERYKDVFAEMSFEIEPFGGNEYAIYGVPLQLYGMQAGDIFIEILDQLSDESKSIEGSKITYHIASMACKAAVKGHDKLHDIEIKRLLEDLSVLKDPYHCPHGRPILIRLPEKEIEKEFKRIV